MQSKWMMGLVAAATVALSGCVSPCEDLSNATDQLIEKIRPCLQPGQTTTRFNVNQCEASINQCTSAEREALGKYANCLRELPNCAPGTQQAFETSLAACVLSVDAQVGATCEAALSN